MAIEWKIKPFEALSVDELYNLLKLRSEICSGAKLRLSRPRRQRQARVASFAEFGEVVAHARLIKPGISFDNASIGRVVVDANYRDRNGTI
jgi:ElaA protein